MDKAPVLLFAEDDADIAFLVCREFRRLLPDWEICHAADGAEAIRRLERGLEPGLLVTDLNMPGVDGFALIEWVRRKKGHNLSIFVLSSSNEPHTRTRCRDLGADQFFTKDMGGLQQTVAALMACHQKKDGSVAPEGPEAGLELSEFPGDGMHFLPT